MFSILIFVIFFFIYPAHFYGPHQVFYVSFSPRIVSNNGNLIIYAADHKNISLRTTNHGYINLNGDNLVLLMKEARSASGTVKNFQTNIIDPFTSTVNRIYNIVEGPDGLLQRVSVLENNGTGTSSRILLPNRNRNIIVLARRVRSLELSMSRISRLLQNNECTSNPCKNGGECQDMYSAFFCRCSDFWTGATCETDVNECNKFSGTALGCQNGATCVNKPGSYECVCSAGWFGIHCNRRSQDCNSGSPQELCGHGTCVSQNTGTGYTCICDQGWATEGIKPACTVDINECEARTPHCSINPPVPCINVPGTFYCGSCPQGYSGNGYYCSDIDECLTNNGGCSNNPKVQCINTMGSKMCGPCPPGYIGDGITCSFRGLCQINNGGCHPLARCLENSNIGDNYVQCICPNSYSGTGMGPNGCSRNDLIPHITACSSNPCIHGTCSSNSNTTYSCKCNSEYTGVRCNFLKNGCDSSPCLNGGTCVSKNNILGFVCECSSNFTGYFCDTERQVCGGKLSGSVGVLRFPFTNGTHYNPRLSCSWVIQTVSNQVLNISFTNFHLEESKTCTSDWLQIHDGPNSASQLIGRFCGKELPKGGIITTTHNTVYIWFRSDHTVQKPGFALRWSSIQSVCGESIWAQSHGTIKSPGFPGHYPPNRNCEWLIIGQYGKRIQFHFFSIKIGNNPNCSFDYLEIYAGLTPLDHRLAQYCNSSQPEPLITPGGSALVRFYSDASGSDEGFQIFYTMIEGIPGCGGTFTTLRGEIGSPSNDNQYQSNMDCEYKIKLPKYFRIKITFISFSMEGSSTCKFDSVTIHEGSRQDDPLVGRYCGSTIPPSYISLSNELYIRFITDSDINDDGFRIKYESICGLTLSELTGQISIPEFPIASSGEGSCVYIIKQEVGKAIKLNITQMAFGFLNSPCNLNYVEIRDGVNENSTLIGKYCGSKSPPEIISTHNYLWIKYVQTIKFLSKTFQANYSTIDIVCGGILSNSAGLIQSPLQLSTYPPNTKCTWVLLAPPGFIVQLNWIKFEVESSNTCMADYISVYENNTDSDTSALIGKYCGTKLPPLSTSTSNVVTIFMVTDSSISYDGFILSYNFLDNSKTCGGNYFVSTGIIQTPNYPDRYPSNKLCIWVISVPNGQQIMLNIEDFDLEPYYECRSDFLELRNGPMETSPLIGIFCGTTIPKQIPSHTNNLYLKFHSDVALNRKGFKIFWDGTSTGCGGTLTSATGLITSPNYPQPYGQNAICLWKITTSAGSIIQLGLLDLSLEDHILCRLDYVEFFDGLTYASKSLGKYCTEQHPTFISTTSNKALIKFKSDMSHQMRGFQLKHTTNCNNTLSGYRGVIESLNFPNTYPKNQNCIWTINAPSGNKINISFSHFELEPLTTKGCKFDYLEIIEDYGYDVFQPLLNKTCGTDLPPAVNSSTNHVQIHFVSDRLVHAPGFRLEWVIEGCSAHLTRPTGEISTPGYPNAYPDSTVCEWKIQVDFNQSVELHIEKFYFEKSVNCEYDSLKIYNGPDEAAPLITQICHIDENGIDVRSTSNLMFVQFTSDVSNAGRGFRGTYKTVPSQCGGIYKYPRGSISSRNYPKNYKEKDNCEWLIQVDVSYVVLFMFEDFDILTSKNCSNDYLKIYDGENDEAPLLHTFCGNKIPNETIQSTSNFLYLRMATKSRGTAKGFLANYTVACGMKVVVSTNGLIDMTDWGSWECSWTILSDTIDKHVSLTITHMDISKDCSSPVLKIYDGESDEAPLIGGYCGNKSPSLIVSVGNAMHITLNYAYGATFQAVYSVIKTDCGGILTSTSGYFASIGYPNNYPMNTECQWTLQLAPGNQIQLTFQSFDLISSDNCNSDYVEIRETSAHGKLLGVFCGSDLPNNITQTNALWIQFKSTDIGTAKGFLAEYTLVHGNELFGSSGQIASPLYPKIFFDTLLPSITWKITVDFDSTIIITFNDFYVESYTNDKCYIVSLEIFDGYDETSPKIADLCSLMIPEPIKTSSNVAFIKFNVASYRYSFKFLLEWAQIKRTVANNTSVKIPEVEGCGLKTILSISDRYIFKSPGYPNGYARNLYCEWIFSSTPGNHLSIIFSFMDLLANNPQCNSDYVKIFTGEGGKAIWKELNILCLSNATMLAKIHSTNLMKIVFKTDGFGNRTGFEAAIYPECGGYLSDPNGIIEISNTSSPRNLALIMTCEWYITVRPGRTIGLQFSEFHIRNSDSNICKNYILLKNGRYPESPYLGNGYYCGTLIPEVNYSSGNAVYIKYYSTPNFNNFKLSYKEISQTCGGYIKLTHSYANVNISSPNYPNVPSPYTECIWIISAPAGESLQMDFTERFDITTSLDCSHAGLEIRDGGTKMSNVINVLCEDDPSSQRTTDNMMFVRFYTEVKNPRNGFMASVSIATCGGIIRGDSGQLTSPHFPSIHTLPINTICTWKIIGPIDHYLRITFNEIKLPFRPNCSTSNHLLITEKIQFGNETTLGIFCGYKNPPVITTLSNIVIIQMKILLQYTTKGFSLSFESSQEKCGGTIRADSGIITSPGYPVSSHNKRNCIWVIIVPKGRRVTVEILDFDLDDSVYYYSQGLDFFNQKSVNSHIKYMYARDSTRIIQSSDNQLTAHFWATEPSNHRGFKLKFSSNEPTICIGDLNKDTGVISAPTANVTTYFCEWKRTIKSDEIISNKQTLVLTIHAPLIGQSTAVNCKHSSSSITITADKDESTIKQFCGSYTEPQILRSPFPTTTIMVTNGRYDITMNFTIYYRLQTCGGIISDSSGIITSPNSTNQPSEDTDCAWLIKLEEGQSIMLNFTSLQLDNSCTKEYIDVYNGGLPSSPKIGRFCGSQIPHIIQSESGAIWIDYHRSTLGNGKGFSISYEPVISGCGGIFYDRTRPVQTPNYPNSYPNNVECLWEFRSQDGYHIGLSFVERFHLEENANCTSDFIEVWDYMDNEWVSLGRKCGRNSPPYFNSTSSRMRLLFRSNSKLVAAGFKAKWDINCGGIFKATKNLKYIISPGYPLRYISNLNCKYELNAPNEYINVVFEDFKIEADSHCAYDNVTILSNRYSTPYRLTSFRSHFTYLPGKMQIPIGVFCGYEIPPPIRRTSSISILFRTDRWVTRKGFKLRYFIDNCGGFIIQEGEISSPSDVTKIDKYYGGINCKWNITAPSNMKIVVRFTLFELEHHMHCQYDNVALYDGSTIETKQRLALLCGNITNYLPVIKSSNNNMIVVMKTDASSHFKGFKASVMFMYGSDVGCGGTINLTQEFTQKTILSPNINNTGYYTPNLDCSWLILAPSEETIQLKFEAFHLDDAKNCTCDYLQIRDGGGSLAELIGQYCGHNLPSEITSSANQLWIRMVSDGLAESTGFRVIVKKTRSICGPSILSANSSKQLLSSPDFPQNYPNNLRCIWIIKSSPSYSKIELHFDHLNLQESDTEDKCTQDKLDIYDKMNSHSVADGLGQNFVFAGPKSLSLFPDFRIPMVSYTYCGSGLPTSFYSLKNEVVVSFTSDGSVSKSGFQIDYRTIGCNHNYTALQGRVLNQGVANNCTIKISVPENYTISIYFVQLLMTDNNDCKLNGLEIFDGLVSNATQLANLCGFRIPNPVFSFTNEVWIKIKSLRRGIGLYDFNYISSDQGRGCGGFINSITGRLTSPLYPLNNRNNSVCRWDITVPRSLQILLKFVVFDLSPLNTCSTDYIEIMDINVATNTETVRSKYCAGDIPATFVSTTNVIGLRYTTSINNGGSGWVVTFYGQQKNPT